MMRMTFRLCSAACLLTATLGCQPEPELEPDVSTDMVIDLGEPDAVVVVPGTSSNLTATGELPDSNITGAAEIPAVGETPEVTETPAVTEVPPSEVEKVNEEPAAAEKAQDEPAGASSEPAPPAPPTVE